MKVSGSKNLIEHAPKLSRRLLVWYDAHNRPFAWRQEPTPYRIWVSEIMLQQTRIEAALPYFDRFMKALPTVHDLAAADESQLLKLWEGLGYYSRVRNLHKAAQIVVDQYGGQLPAEYDQLLALPGIGEYTAGAIASMAFGLPVPAIDGNVLRVAARLTGDEGDVLSAPVKKRLRQTVNALLPSDRPGDFNQALMELGETVCLPNTVPLCNRCPFFGACCAQAQGNPERLPLRTPKKQRRIEKRTVMVVICEQKVLIHRRKKSGLLAGMWELPAKDGWLSELDAAKAVIAFGAEEVSFCRGLGQSKHLFSHVEWCMKGYRLEVPFFIPRAEYMWADAHLLATEIALPSAFRPFTAELPKLPDCT